MLKPVRNQNLPPQKVTPNPESLGGTRLEDTLNALINLLNINLLPISKDGRERGEGEEGAEETWGKGGGDRGGTRGGEQQAGCVGNSNFRSDLKRQCPVRAGELFH